MSSLSTLWMNRYIMADLKIDRNKLSMAQLGTSVLGGLITELALVGWSGSKVGIRRVWNDGLKDIVVLGIIRVATILFGLTALKYINVSFTRTLRVY